MNSDLLVTVLRDEAIAFLNGLKEEALTSIERLDYISLSSKSTGMSTNQYLQFNHTVQALMDVQKSRVAACDSAFDKLNGIV